MKSLHLSKPHLLVTVGIPGSGKSTFAQKFATMFRAPCVTYDDIRPFTDNDQNARYIMNHQISELLKTRQTIVIDGGADTRSERAELARLARAAGYENLLIWIQTDPATAKARAMKPAKDSQKYTLSSEEYDRLFRHFSIPSMLEKTVVISGKHTYATQAKIVLKKLSESRSTSQQPSPPARPDASIRRNIIIH